jgi:hypothetical protein
MSAMKHVVCNSENRLFCLSPRWKRLRACRRAGNSLKLAGGRAKPPDRTRHRVRDGQSALRPPMSRSRLLGLSSRSHPCRANRVRRDAPERFQTFCPSAIGQNAGAQVGPAELRLHEASFMASSLASIRVPERVTVYVLNCTLPPLCEERLVRGSLSVAAEGQTCPC